jgi:murein L,D-transpeptidase YafK
MRTPEGIYFFTDVYEKPNLIRTYGQKEALQFGIRAFTIDYPNEFDYIKNKEGYGIWLHGTDISERLIPTNTKGCIVLSDTDLEELTSYIILNNTPIIITKEITYKPASELETEYTAVTKFLEKWRRSWENRDFAAYEQTYSRSFKSGLLNLKQWVADKKQMLQKYSTVSITVSDLKILKADDYYVVEFYQEFLAGIYSDTGIKRLYLFNNEGKLEIMSEKWKQITPFK